MILREFKAEDASVICKWLRNAEELYKWSADRFNKFPLTSSDINNSYSSQTATRRFFPLTMIDNNNDVRGHFIIRYPREDDDSSVRFGFVIVDPDSRNKGFGKEMILLGIEYVKEHFSVKRIDLGVFINNEIAKRCYESVGFREYNRRQCEMPIGVWTCIDMELHIDQK